MSQRPSGNMASPVTALLCPSSRRVGGGTVFCVGSGRFQRNISPFMFPATSRFGEPAKVAAVTQALSQGIVQTGAALSKLAGAAGAGSPAPPRRRAPRIYKNVMDLLSVAAAPSRRILAAAGSRRYEKVYTPCN